MKKSKPVYVIWKKKENQMGKWKKCANEHSAARFQNEKRKQGYIAYRASISY